MRISGRFFVRRVHQGKSGYYADLVDLETGGDLRLVFPEQLPDEVIMVPVSIDAVVDPRVYSGRHLALVVTQYTTAAA